MPLAACALLAAMPLALGAMLVRGGTTEREEYQRTAQLTANAAGRLAELSVHREPRPCFPWGETYVIRLRYEYAVGGRGYEGEALRDAFLRGQLREVRARLERYAPASSAVVY